MKSIAKPEFVHLHNHTEYSLLDGACRVVEENKKYTPGELLRQIANYRMPALAITDHGNLYGIIEFYSGCRNAGIKPILGLETYIAPESRFIKKQQPGMEVSYHLTLLAKDEQGYRNLIQLSSLAFLEGFYYHPRIDKELLEKYRQGLIVMSGCIKGEIPWLILNEKYDQAIKVAEYYQNLLGKGNFYIELMDNGLTNQKKVLPELIRLGKKLDIPVVATNDCHYLHKRDALLQDVLLCIGTGKKVEDKDRLRFGSEEFYYKTAEEMDILFSSVPEAITNTLRIAEQCNVEIRFNQVNLPYFQTPKNETADIYLEKLCRKGIPLRYPEQPTIRMVENRLTHELDIIKQMGFAGYFLIVHDFVQYARNSNIPVGPGRGSGAGSIVAYLLGITNVDPLKYGLLFERFLNPERRTLPDLDIDFSDFGRDKIIQYVRQKYGMNSVAQIITFNIMQARQVIRDVGRVLGIPIETVDGLAKLIPPGSTVFSAMKSIPEFKHEVENNTELTKLVNIAEKLEGLKRHSGIHAAGVVIAKGEITDYVPLAKQPGKDVFTTQYDDDSLIKLGMLKMDILGIRTLTVIDETLRLVLQTKNIKLDLNHLNLKDRKTYHLLSLADTGGVFQLESSGMRELLHKFRPTEIEDITALISLYRPGPIMSHMLDDFVDRKHKRTKVEYHHLLLEPILAETHGVIVYQEQVMRIATDLAKFTPAQADVLRQSMSKKKPEEIERQREQFLEGIKQHKIDRTVGKKIFDEMVKFGGYGFNKSHATAYAFVAYQTAYLKANFPLEYMCALLTSEIGRSTIGEEGKNKIAVYIAECKEKNIKVLPPDVQHSGMNFIPENNQIRFGLLAVKNVGVAAAQSIVEERTKNGPFLNWMDFLRRIDNRTVNRKVLESLIKSGATDCFGKHRSELFASLEVLLDKIVKTNDEINTGSLFSDELTSNLSQFEEQYRQDEWPEHTILNYEKEVLGFYVSGHPLTRWANELKIYSTISLNELPVYGLRNELNEDGTGADTEQYHESEPHPVPTRVRIAGLIKNVQRLVSKKKEQFARFKLENLENEIDIVVFPKPYAKGLHKLIRNNEMVIVSGKLNQRSGGWEIFADDIIPFTQARDKFVRRVWVIVPQVVFAEDLIAKFKKKFESHPGNVAVGVKVLNEIAHTELVVDLNYRVQLNPGLINDLEHLVGRNCVHLETA